MEHLVNSIERHGAMRFQQAHGHIVTVHLLLRVFRDEVGGIQHAQHFDQLERHLRGADFQFVCLALNHGSAPHPEEVRSETAADQRRRLVIARHQFAGADVELCVQCEPRGLARGSPGTRRGMKGLDRTDARTLAGRVEGHFMADHHMASQYRSGKDSPVVASFCEFVDILDREAEGKIARRGRTLQRVELIQHRGTIIPRHFGLSAIRNIESVHGADRDEPERMNIKSPQEFFVFGAQRVEDLPVVADQVHLVDERDQLPDSQHGDDVAVPARVFLDAFTRVNQNERRLGAGGSGDHVAQKLDVSGSVNQDVAPTRGLEEASRRVDRDSLGLLILQGVEQEGVFEGFRIPGACSAHLIQLSLRKRMRISQQAADQGALAVVHVPDRHDVDLFFLFHSLYARLPPHTHPLHVALPS